MATSKVISMAKFVPNTNSFDTKNRRLKVEAWSSQIIICHNPGGLAFHPAKTVKGFQAKHSEVNVQPHM